MELHKKLNFSSQVGCIVSSQNSRYQIIVLSSSSIEIISYTIGTFRINCIFTYFSSIMCYICLAKNNCVSSKNFMAITLLTFPSEASRPISEFSSWRVRHFAINNFPCLLWGVNCTAARSSCSSFTLFSAASSSFCTQLSPNVMILRQDFQMILR